MGITASTCCEEAPAEPPKEVLTASHTADASSPSASDEEKGSNKSSMVERIGNFQVDSEILRGIPLRRALWQGGRLFRRSPLDLSEQQRANLWQRSRPVEGFDIFLSHTWQTNAIWKVVALMLQTSWHYYWLSYWLLMILVLVLCHLQVLPVTPWLPNETPFLAIGGGSQREEFSIPWAATFGLLSWLAIPLYVYLPSRRQDTAFLDVVSIHQTDQELMERGIYGLAGFLRVSRELRILWSSRYFTRLWCVFEMAAYRSANPSGKIRFAPIFVELTVFWLVLGGYAVSFVYWSFMTDPSITRASIAYVVALAPCIFAIHSLRRSMQMKHKMFADLASFDLANAECRKESDVKLVHTVIAQWYGSAEAFVNFVRGPLREEMLEQTTGSGFVAVYVPLFLTGPASAGFDILSMMMAAKASSVDILSFVLGPFLSFHVVWVAATLRLRLCLCEQTVVKWSFVPYEVLQSAIIFFAMEVQVVVGYVITHLVYRSSLWAISLWLFFSATVTILLFTCCKLNPPPPE